MNTLLKDMLRFPEVSLFLKTALVTINLLPEEESKGKKKGPPPGWIEFLKEKYEGGKKRVPNTNPKTKAKFKEVATSTLLKSDKNFLAKVKKEYEAWFKDNKDKFKSKDKGKDKEPEKKKTLPDSRLSFHDEQLESQIKEFQEKYKSVFDTMDVSKSAIQSKGLELNAALESLVSSVLEDHFQSKGLKENYVLFRGQWQADSDTYLPLEMCKVLENMGVKHHSAPKDAARYEKRKEDMQDFYGKAKVNSYVQSLETIFKDTYAIQQAFLRDKGIDSITLYRGVKGKSDPAFGASKYGTKAKINTRAISSFTGNPQVAFDFVDENAPRPCLMQFEVPAHHIFMSPMIENRFSVDNTIGPLKEEEYVILGASDLIGTKMRYSKKTLNYDAPTVRDGYKFKHTKYYLSENEDEES